MGAWHCPYLAVKMGSTAFLIFHIDRGVLVGNLWGGYWELHAFSSSRRWGERLYTKEMVWSRWGWLVMNVFAFHRPQHKNQLCNAYADVGSLVSRLDLIIHLVVIHAWLCVLQPWLAPPPEEST